MHDIITDISKFKNNKEQWAFYVFIGGCLFLLFNWYFVTCFCGIFENSQDCLIINIVMSIIFSSIFSLALIILSSYLRKYGLTKKNKTIYNISLFLNPILHIYDNDIE